MEDEADGVSFTEFRFSSAQSAPPIKEWSMIPAEQPSSGQISHRVSVFPSLFALFRLLLLLFLLLLPFRFRLALRVRPFRLRLDSRRRR